jgi:hypothetical protein
MAAAARLHQAAWAVIAARLKDVEADGLERMVIRIEAIFAADDQDGP